MLPKEEAGARLIGPAAARLARLGAYASVSAACVLIVAKLAAFILTDSVALLGSLVDSLLDASASLLNLVALRHASQPADRSHRFGHGKAEAIAGLGQASLIAGSAAFLFFESASRLHAPVALDHSRIGLLVTVFSLAVTLVLVAFQRHVVRRTGSLAITADSLHYRGDIIMNASVLAALVLAGEYGFRRADAAFGLVIAGYIGWSAWQILRQAFDQLMDRELPDSDRQRIRAIAEAEPDVLAMHDLRTRASGFNIFIQMHLELDPAMSLTRAHAIADRVEGRIKEAFPNAEVIIHEDPAGTEKPPIFAPDRSA